MGEELLAHRPQPFTGLHAKQANHCEQRRDGVKR